MRQHLRSVAGFALLPAFSLLASLVLLPLVSSRFGAEGWIALGTGQSIGAVVTIVCGLSWFTTGGHAVAVADSSTRWRIFRLSLLTRGAVLGVCLPVASIVVLVVNDDQHLAAWLFMVGVALNSFSMSWYFAGTASPRHLAVNEGVVRLAGYGIASVLLLMGGALWQYAAATVMSSLVSLLLNYLTVRATTLRHPIRRETGFATELRTQLQGTAARTAFALFTLGGPAIFAIGASGAAGATADYNGVDQMLKASVSATAILPQAFIAVVAASGRGHGASWWRRPESLVLLWLPAAALATWCVAGPTAARYLFSDRLDLPGGLAVLIGVALAATMTLRSFEILVMVPRGLVADVFRINAALSLIGVALLFASALAESVAAALMVWTLVHVLIYALEAWRLHRSPAPASLGVADQSMETTRSSTSSA